MGMLTLAGAVSGGGKALQQGLAQTQQYMSQSMLLKEREDMERARMDITYGREVGLMRERQRFDLERDDRQASLQLDRDERREDFEMRRGRIERSAAREDAATQYDRQKERDVTNKVLDASYDQQKDATKTKAERAKEDRDRQEKRRERQEDTGKDIVLESMRGQRPHVGSAASAKMDPNTNAQLKVFTDRIGRLEDEMNNVMTTKERRAEIQKEIATLEGRQNSLLGIPSNQRERPQYRFPD